MTNCRGAVTPQKQRGRDRGQATIEAVLSLVGSLVLFYGIIVIWGWVNQSLVGRQAEYQRTRVAAGTSPQLGVANPYTQSVLSIFGEESGVIDTTATTGGRSTATRRTDPRALVH